MSEIIVEKLRHIYSAGTPFEVAAIEDIDLVIPQGQLAAVIGHTGSGKSTFIQHLNALLSPSSGKVSCGGKDINENKLSRKAVKSQVGLVFQYPEYQLFEETVYKDIAFGPRNMKLPEEEVDQRVREAAGFTGVEEELLDKSPLELSGGQKRRVAIAGVIAMRPGVLILDEPTAGLDPAGCRQIMENICAYREKTGATVIIVSHNMDDVARIAERIIVFSHGRIVMDGSAREVFSRAQELVEIGLDVPHATELAMELKKRGLPLPDGIYTHEQLLSSLLELKGVASC
ncbi:MAG TPA: energy-coupling factor transporter ATPase [Candidatus Limivicinus faecipullorum]|nr:energy-coupling factor transporter ATPase [Candidatus Limivicinus faecipullorum]